jgi:lipid-A-disaccharide synthase
MVIAGEISGDLLAADLVTAMRAEARAQGTAEPVFFGAGGDALAQAGAEIVLDLPRHAVVGVVEVLKNLGKFRRFFRQLIELACARQPEVIILVDFSGFNRRFAAALRQRLSQNPAVRWRPRIVQYVSPQVWASRPSRAKSMARDLDLLVCLFPFEKEWYAQRYPQLRAEWVGHPLLDRVSERPVAPSPPGPAQLLLLPGSRVAELERHLPVLLEAVKLIRSRHAVRCRMVLPREDLAETARRHLAGGREVQVQVGGLTEALAEATVALASTGTVTLECALMEVPTVALYKTSWLTYQIAIRMVSIRFAAMPNLILDRLVFPEFLQEDATPRRLADAAGRWLASEAERQEVRAQLREVRHRLGEAGASHRAARLILGLFAAG